ncbi:MAG: metallophosphoesterase [Filifactoraceae bacterium]
MFKLIFKIINFIFIIGIIILLYSFFMEPKLLTSRTEVVKTGTLNEEITIVQFTDTHIGPNYDIDQLEKLVKKINSKKPDIIIFSGDLIDVAREYGRIDEITPTLEKLNSRLGKFAVYGNHDYGGGAKKYFSEIMNNSGFVILKNESFLLKINESENINIIGLDEAMLGAPDYSVSVNKIVSESPNILILHEPDLINKMDTTNIDVSFSGHSHGGQVSIPYIRDYVLPPYGRNYVKGNYKINDNNTLYVSSGIGTTRIHARFLNFPEFVVYKFK